MDALRMLTEQHDEVEALFRRAEDTTPADEQERIDIARSIIEHLSRHAGIEEVAFYPTIRDALPTADEEIDHDLEEHQEAKVMLDQLEGCDPASTEYDDIMANLAEAVRHHVEEEEDDLFPRVEQVLTQRELEELGRTMERLMKVVPTRPHPHEPSTPPGNVATGPIAGAVDRLRDEIRDRTADTNV